MSSHELFDTYIERRGSASIKHDRYASQDSPNVLQMWVADMDFRSPAEVTSALKRKAEDGIFGYVQPPTELAPTVQNYIKEHFKWEIKPEWLVWTYGTEISMNLVTRAFGDKNDNIATFTPIYPPFINAILNAGKEPNKIPLNYEKNSWSIDFDKLNGSIDDKTKLLLFCNPHNPVGRMYSEEELKLVAEIAKEKNLVICSDEVFSGLTLEEGRSHIPIASLDEDTQGRTITLMSPSKTFNLSGLSFSFAIIPNEELREEFTKTGKGINNTMNIFSYEAALAAYKYGEPWRKNLIDYLRGNRDVVERYIQSTTGINSGRVEATYLSWIDTRELGIENPHEFFLNAGVRLNDGKEFDAKGFVRLNFGTQKDTVVEAMERISSAVKSL